MKKISKTSKSIISVRKKRSNSYDVTMAKQSDQMAASIYLFYFYQQNQSEDIDLFLPKTFAHSPNDCLNQLAYFDDLVYRDLSTTTTIYKKFSHKQHYFSLLDPPCLLPKVIF